MTTHPLLPPTNPVFMDTATLCYLTGHTPSHSAIVRMVQRMLYLHPTDDALLSLAAATEVPRTPPVLRKVLPLEDRPRPAYWRRAGRRGISIYDFGDQGVCADPVVQQRTEAVPPDTPPLTTVPVSRQFFSTPSFRPPLLLTHAMVRMLLATYKSLTVPRAVYVHMYNTRVSWYASDAAGGGGRSERIT